MKKEIIQEVVFKNTKPTTIFDLYMDANKHATISGKPVTISADEGSAFSAHGGYISGKTIKAMKDKLIVQGWRAMDWSEETDDSTLIIMLEAKEEDTVLNMIHTNVPEDKMAGVAKGWYGHYWNPWKQFLAGEDITRPQM